MAEHGIEGRSPRRKRRLTVADESPPRPVDLVERRFVTERPDQLWPEEFRSRFEAELAIVEYVGWFNDVRLHSEIGDVRPSELEAEYRGSLSLR